MATPHPYETAGINAGLNPALARFMPRYVQIESGGNPNARTGSYTGLLQMGPDEIKRYGGNGIDQGAAMYANNAKWFANKYGRDPSPTELYMIAQQGQGGVAAHLANPNELAWKNMYLTKEGQQKGPDWSRSAIAGNIPADVRAQYPGVESLTSQDYLNMWQRKVEGQNAQPFSPVAPQQPQQPAAPSGDLLGSAVAQAQPTPGAGSGLTGNLLASLGGVFGLGGGQQPAAPVDPAGGKAAAPQPQQQQQQAGYTPEQPIVPQLQAPQIAYYRPQPRRFF